jgi:hypothetical protein
LAGGLVLLLAGCSVVLGLDPPTYDGPLSTPDSSVEAAPVEAAAPILPGKLDDPTRWATYDGQGGGYMVGPFDGKFIYFVRSYDVDGPDAGLTGSRILRYDTRSASFTDPKAWTAFDPEVALATTGPHAAAVMEGKYLVIAALADTVFLRYDTTRPDLDFGFSSSWETYEASKLPGNPAGYTAAVPLPGDAGAMFNNGAAYTPLIHRGDSFKEGWEVTTFDGGTFPGGCATTFNGVCTGNHLFFTPAGSGSTACLVRYDPSKSFLEGFESFDVASLGEESALIAGGVASPQHLYLTQFQTHDAAAPTRILRKPVEGALDAGWESQPTNTKNPLARGNVGGTYDGRFVYFAPYPAPTTTVIFERYDTQGGFNDPNAWDVAAGAALGIPANRYWGAVFDGQYVYYSSYTPLGNEKAAFARFKAWDTPIAVPPACR